MYNGLQIELQLRTRTQHAWATAVETVGTFLGQSLKSSQGRKDWLRFFELIGSGFAVVEGAPVAENVPSDSGALMRQIRRAAQHLKVKETLEAFGKALNVVEHDQMREYQYFLLVLEPTKDSLAIHAYRHGDLARANDAYLAAEQRLADTAGDVVLVASDSLESLRRAFPNYFADTERFVADMERLLA